MNIVIFGGSFDPVHAEHIALAQAAKRQLAADKVIVVPAFVPPHKREKNMAPAEDRLAMAKLAFAGVEGAEVSAYEISAGGTSYTVRTLRHFRERFAPGIERGLNLRFGAIDRLTAGAFFFRGKSTEPSHQSGERTALAQIAGLGVFKSRRLLGNGKVGFGRLHDLN